MKQDLYLISGDLFAREFVRVVHGQRGDYIEFTRDQILLRLGHHFVKGYNEAELYNLGYYYVWMYPEFNHHIKVYKQLRPVKYADYIPGMYYVALSMFVDFKDPEKLF